MANLALNKVILCGRLCRDPELKVVGNEIPICEFDIAVNRKKDKNGEQKSDFIHIRSWKHTAEFVSKYFSKGSSICVCGALRTDNFTDKDGNKKSRTYVVADEVNFVDSRAEGSKPEAVDAAVDNAIAAAPSEYEAVTDTSDLPF